MAEVLANTYLMGYVEGKGGEKQYALLQGWKECTWERHLMVEHQQARLSAAEWDEFERVKLEECDIPEVFAIANAVKALANNDAVAAEAFLNERLRDFLLMENLKATPEGRHYLRRDLSARLLDSFVDPLGKLTRDTLLKTGPSGKYPESVMIGKARGIRGLPERTTFSLAMEMNSADEPEQNGCWAEAVVKALGWGLKTVPTLNLNNKFLARCKEGKFVDAVRILQRMLPNRRGKESDAGVILRWCSQRWPQVLGRMVCFVSDPIDPRTRHRTRCFATRTATGRPISSGSRNLNQLVDVGTDEGWRGPAATSAATVAM
jgi:hypothetical protein